MRSGHQFCSRSPLTPPSVEPAGLTQAEFARPGPVALLAEPDLEFRAFCTRKGLPSASTLQLERTWDTWQAERYQRGETAQRPDYTDNPFRPR